MNRCVKWLLFASLNVVVAVFAGCSGGSGPASGAGAAPAAVNKVTGVAATGAPVVKGVVFLKDSSDKAVELTQSTRSDGSFAFDATGLKPPFFLKVVGSSQNLYSVATDFGMTNITPLTTIVVAYAAKVDDLNNLYTTYKPADISSIAQKMPDSDKAVQDMFAPLMSAFEVKGSLVNGAFSANHTGMDALMDAITVSVVPGSITVTQKDNSMQLLNVAAVQLGGAVLATNAAAPMAPPAPAAPTSGSALYTAKCAGCHGDSANSNLAGRITLTSAQSAIASNRGGMGMLNGLSTADIQAIIDSLAATTPAASAPTASAPASTPAPAATPAAPADGAALYAAKCAGCHGSLASSSKTGITVVRLQNAIGGNIGGMGFLSTLSAADTQALVTALNPATPTPAPAAAPSSTPMPTPAPAPAPILDGSTLYSANCAGCHGPLATSSKTGITLARLQSAITNNIGNMSFLSVLTSGQQQALVGVLAPAPVTVPAPSTVPAPVPVSDGAALYSANCAGCHGALASSSKKGITIARLQSAIANNTGGMGYLSTLTVSDVQALVTVLTPATPTPTPTPTPVVDGPTLYGSYCASCHGALASSSKAGATASRIQTAVNSNTGTMGSLSVLTSAQVTAIASALAAVVPAPAPAPAPTPVVDGPTLYGSYCASCHGPLASSTKAGATVSRIQTAIASNTGTMGSLSVLTSAQVTAIASALATVTPTPVPAPVCGSCHAIPPSSGHHSTHKSAGVACGTCHGTGYSSTSFNVATHNNGVINIASGTTPGWNATTRSCSNSCHGSKSW